MRRKGLVIFCVGIAVVLCGCSKPAEYKDEYIQISQYTGVETNILPPIGVTETEVDSEIENMLAGYADVKESGSPAEEGDIVVMDYSGKAAGFEVASAKDCELTAGKEGLSKSVIGHKQGETYEWTDGDADEEVVYMVTLKQVGRKVMPELTDSLVKEMSDKSSTVNEFREEVKKRLEETSETEYRNELSESAFESVLENTEVLEYSEDEVNEALEQIEAQYKTAAESCGMEYEPFITEYMGYRMGDYEEEIKTAAENLTKENLVVRAIAEQEKILQTEEEITSAAKALALRYGYADVEEMYADIGEDDARQYVLADAVKIWVAEHAD